MNGGPLGPARVAVREVARGAGRTARIAHTFLAGALLLGGPSAASAATRFGGDANVLYRNSGGHAQGIAFRRVTFDQRLNASLNGDLVGPKLGHYLISGGADFLNSDGVSSSRNDVRRRMHSRLTLLPRSAVSVSSFYTLERSSVRGGFLESSRADAYGASAAARLLPRSTSTAERERREDDAVGGQVAMTDHVSHQQSVSLGNLSLNGHYDFSNRRLDANAPAVSYRAERHTGRVDEQLKLGRLGLLRSWWQLDRERSRTLRGALPDRGLDNQAASGELETPLGARASLRQAYSDELYRSTTAGVPTSLRFRIAEERFDGRTRANAGNDLHLLVRGQYNRVERQPDLWVASAIGELLPSRPEGWSVSPRAGVNVYSGGAAGGSGAGEVLALGIARRSPNASLQIDAGRERTRGSGYTGRLQGDGLRGFSPRQSGTQRVHSVRVATSFGRGALAFRQDYEYQQVRNTTLGIDFDMHQVGGSFSYRVNERLWTDLAGDYQSTDQGGVYFGGLRQSVTGTLSIGWRPGGSFEVSSRASYGRIPTGTRESFWLLENSLGYRLAKLDLQLLQRNEKRASDPGFADLGRDERLFELRATRRFDAYLR